MVAIVTLRTVDALMQAGLERWKLPETLECNMYFFAQDC